MPLLLALTHLVFAAWLQLENYLLYAFRPADGWDSTVAFVLRLPLLQLENAAFAALVALVAQLGKSSRLGRAGAATFWAVANLYLVVDQIAYRISLDHVKLSLADGRVERLGPYLGSFVAELSPAFYGNLALWLVVSAFGLKLAFSGANLTAVLPAAVSARLKRVETFVGLCLEGSARELATAVTIVGLSAAALVFTRNFNLDHHPVFRLAYDSIPRRQKTSATRRLLEPALFNTIAAPGEEPPETGRALAELARKIQARKRPPNVVMIVLESVGSAQLFENGVPSGRLAPNLHAMAQKSAVFSAVYAPFPGTVRSHVALQAGGRTLTWGSVFEELLAPYAGPTLVSFLKSLGYQTALYSAGTLEFENTDTFYRQLGFDRFFHFGEAPAEFQARTRLHSWGGSEEAMLSEALQWITQRDRAHPFYLSYLSIATHHPYGVPAQYKAPFPATDAKAMYENSIFYTDEAIGAFVGELDRRHLLSDTIIVVSGDHGEAFAEHHRGNTAHKNFLYEENVRSFFMVYDPADLAGPIVSARVASIGDVMPSLGGLLSAKPVDAPGANLFSERLPSRVAFFHKNATPELWGLRDGKYKYISELDGSNAELYDLETDPTEQTNLAAGHVEAVGEYQKKCEAWYGAANAEFVSRLKGFAHDFTSLTDKDALTRPGPKLLTVGGYTNKASVQELLRLNPYEDLAVWVHWVAYQREHSVNFVFTSPGGRVHTVPFALEADWTRTRVRPNLGAPLEEGSWRVEIIDAGVALLAKTFEVAREAPLANDLLGDLLPFERLSFASENRLQVLWKWSRRGAMRARLSCAWRGPGGAHAEREVLHVGMEDFFDCGIGSDAPRGEYQITLRTPDRRLIARAHVVKP